MKNLCNLFLFAAALSLGAGYLKIGAPVPEFGKGVWAKNKSCSIAAAVKGQKMTAVLFWKPEHASAVAMQSFSRFGHQSQNKNIAFAAVADGKLQNILKFPLINQLGTIPLLIDTDKANFKRFLRPENRLPIAILIGKDGKLLWRGTPTRLPSMIATVEKGKYNQKKVMADDDFNANFTGMISKSDFKGALALLDKELTRAEVNPRDIVSLQVGIHYRRLNSAENALKAIHQAQKKYPLDPGFYEMELKMLELAHLEKRMGEFYFRLTSVFKNQPRVLLKFVAAEMNRPFAQMNPANIYTVARAAANAGKYSGKNEKGRAMLYYAQSLYCLGRVDVASKVADEALPLLKGAKEYKQAEEMAMFYRKLVHFSPTIKK